MKKLESGRSKTMGNDKPATIINRRKLNRERKIALLQDVIMSFSNCHFREIACFEHV